MNINRIFIIVGLLILILGVYFLGNNFLSNLLWQGCYDNLGGCQKDISNTFKAYGLITLIILSGLLIVSGLIYKK